MPRAEALAYASQNAARFLADLGDFLAIPSISARPEHTDDVRRAAEFVAAKLRGAGLTAEIVEGDGHPLVTARSPEVPGAPTVLLYGHHDVQPVDPIEFWETPPRSPTRSGPDSRPSRARSGPSSTRPARRRPAARQATPRSSGEEVGPRSR